MSLSHHLLRIFPLLLITLLGACASQQRLPTEGVNLHLYADETRMPAHINTHILWGGIRLERRNDNGRTLQKALSYPLDQRQRPLIS